MGMGGSMRNLWQIDTINNRGKLDLSVGSIPWNFSTHVNPVSKGVLLENRKDRICYCIPFYLSI